jgi:hypothetical protein
MIHVHTFVTCLEGVLWLLHVDNSVKSVFYRSCCKLLLILERVGCVPLLVLWQSSIVLSCFVGLCCCFVYVVLCLFPSPLCFGIGPQTLNSGLLHQVWLNISRSWLTLRGIISRKVILSMTCRTNRRNDKIIQTGVWDDREVCFLRVNEKGLQRLSCKS